MWSELLMTSAISCSLCSSVYECQGVECAFTSPARAEFGMIIMCAVFYVRVNCFVVRGCAVSRRYTCLYIFSSTILVSFSILHFCNSYISSYI